MKLIKLTDEKGQTHGGTQWGENVTHEVEWSGNFGRAGVIHCYRDLLVGLLLNPMHANFSPPRAWEAEGDILADDHGLKYGVAKLTTIREIPIPKITTTQRVRFGILCALEVYSEPSYVAWATAWLSGQDRSASTAHAADASALAASCDAAASASLAAVHAAIPPAYYASDAASYAAAFAAVYTAYYITDAAIDLLSLAIKALGGE